MGTFALISSEEVDSIIYESKITAIVSEIRYAFLESKSTEQDPDDEASESETESLSAYGPDAVEEIVADLSTSIEALVDMQGAYEWPMPDTTQEIKPATERSKPDYITAHEAADALRQAEHGIEIAQHGDSDFNDEGYDSNDSTASIALASSARDYYEQGRHYYAYRAGSYLFPNDEREQDCVDLKHNMFLKLFNRTLHFAPLSKSESMNVIDLGTGTGHWAIDFADLYPYASVLGVDLSPMQPQWVPPNLQFMVDDAESEWLQEPNFFDYIHTRHTIQSFRDWPTLFSRAYHHLKPGGWMECQELDHFPRSEDGSLAPDNPMVTYWKLIADGLAAHGVRSRLAPHLALLMRTAGFVNVTERVFFTPIGPWPQNWALREVGLYWRTVLMEGLEAIAIGPLVKRLGWMKEEVNIILPGVRKAYLERATHASMPFYVIYGQKPPARQV